MSTAKQITPAEGSQTDAMSLVSQAVANGAGIESIDKLIELVKFNDHREALKSFNQAFTAAQSELPAIKRTKKAHNSEYAPLDEVVKQIRPVLMKHGFSFRHEVSENDNETVTVRCILAHEAGHSESATLTGPSDKSGSKNAIQAIGSSVTYLRRYTLEAVTGIVTTDADNDGGPPADRITEQMVADLESKIKEIGADKTKFMEYAKVKDLADIHQNAYPALIKMLENKAKRGKK